MGSGGGGAQHCSGNVCSGSFATMALPPTCSVHPCCFDASKPNSAVYAVSTQQRSRFKSRPHTLSHKYAPGNRGVCGRLRTAVCRRSRIINAGNYIVRRRRGRVRRPRTSAGRRPTAPRWEGDGGSRPRWKHSTKAPRCQPYSNKSSRKCGAHQRRYMAHRNRKCKERGYRGWE